MSNVFDQMRAEGRGDEIGVCKVCGHKIDIHWKNEPKGVDYYKSVGKPMELCGPCYFSRHKS